MPYPDIKRERERESPRECAVKKERGFRAPRIFGALSTLVDGRRTFRYRTETLDENMYLF